MLICYTSKLLTIRRSDCIYSLRYACDKHYIQIYFIKDLTSIYIYCKPKFLNNNLLKLKFEILQQIIISYISEMNPIISEQV